MAVTYSHDLGSFYWSCIWGCRGYEFPTEIEAEQAFLAHECKRGVL